MQLTTALELSASYADQAHLSLVTRQLADLLVGICANSEMRCSQGKASVIWCASQFGRIQDVDFRSNGWKSSDRAIVCHCGQGR